MRNVSLMKLKKNIKKIYIYILIKKYLKKRGGSPCNRVCVLPAAHYGSLGDEAMVVALSGLLNDKGKIISIIDYDSGDLWSSSFKDLFSDHGTLPDNIREWNTFLAFLSKYDSLYINGADVLDGKYSEKDSLDRLSYASLASNMGLNVVITGFSFNKNPSTGIVNFIKGMPKDIMFCCRDIYSHSRFLELTGRKAEQVADLAFALKPDHESHYVTLVKHWIASKKQEGRLLIALAPNVLFKMEQSGQDAVRYANIMFKLHDTHQCSFLLIPHDYRNRPSDLDCIREVYKFCGKLDVLLVDKICSAQELKAIASSLDCAITGRMHFAIACLSSGVPVCGISYQDKFDGIFKMVNQEDCLVESSSFGDIDLLAYKINNIIYSLADRRQAIINKMAVIFSLVVKNILK